MLKRTDESSNDSCRKEQQLCASRTLDPFPSLWFALPRNILQGHCSVFRRPPRCRRLTPWIEIPSPGEPHPAPGPKRPVFIYSAALSAGDELGVFPTLEGQDSQRTSRVSGWICGCRKDESPPGRKHVPPKDTFPPHSSQTSPSSWILRAIGGPESFHPAPAHGGAATRCSCKDWLRRCRLVGWRFPRHPLWHVSVSPMTKGFFTYLTGEGGAVTRILNPLPSP